MTAKTKGRGILARLGGATPEQARDTGLALVLLCLILAYWGGRPQFLPLALVLLVVTMVWPRAFRPLAGVWFGLAHILGTIASTIILSVLFFVLVTPVGLVRRWAGADALQLKKWKRDSSSVFVIRDGPVTPEDLQNPY